MNDSSAPPSDSTSMDPRTYLAAERTFLAWLRTGVALMGFGFVIARFGLFLREIAAAGALAPRASPVGSIELGLLLVIVGVAVNAAAMLRYRRLIQALDAQQFRRHFSTRLPLFTAAVLVAAGAALAVYLLRL